MLGFGFLVSVLGFGVCGFGYRISDLGFGFRVSGLKLLILEVSGFRSRISGLGFRHYGLRCEIDVQGLRSVRLRGLGCARREIGYKIKSSPLDKKFRNQGLTFTF